MAIIFISKLFAEIFGNRGIYLISFFSGFADVDAITITLANLAKTGGITNITAQMGILLAAFSNTIFKGGIAYYLGSRKYSKGILIIFGTIILGGILGLIFIF